MDSLTWLENFIYICGWHHLDASELIKDPIIASYAEDGAQLDPDDEKGATNICLDIQDYLGLHP